MAYDSARGVTVLFGGYGSASQLGDTWEYDGATWVRMSPSASPAPRQKAALAYDSLRARTVLFGGQNVLTGITFADTWEYDGANWVRVTTSTSPPARAGHGLVYDAAHNRVVLFGNGILADTWQYDGADWPQVATAVAPSARAEPVLVYDPVRGRTILFGGRPSLTEVADLWEFDGANWTQIATATSPSGRASSSLVYDLARGRGVLFGGEHNTTLLADTWELLPQQIGTWTRYGIGCAGSAGVPVLDSLPNARPALGTSFTLALTSLPPQPGAAVLLFGTDLVRWNGMALPLPLGPIGMPQCRLWIAPAASCVSLLAHPGSSTTFTFPIPNAAALAGSVVGVQAAVLDPTAATGIGAVTNGGILRVY